MNQCPQSRDGIHSFTFSVGSGTKSDFEPMQFGKNADETLYRRVEYSYLACRCGQSVKRKVVVE